MACSKCKTCENPRTIYCEFDFHGCKVSCDCLNLPVGSLLDWPIDYSDILQSDCDAPDAIDPAQSTVTITHTNGAAGSAIISDIIYETDKMTAWIDAIAVNEGGYFTLEATMVSTGGRRFVHKVGLQAKDIKC